MKRKASSYFPLIAVLAIASALVPTIFLTQQQTQVNQNAASQTASIYYGVNPGDIGQLTSFVNDSGKQPAIVSFTQDWGRASPQIGGSPFLLPAMNQFPRSKLDNLRNSGYIPLVTWAAEQECLPENFFDNHCKNQPLYQLQNITRGSFDSYITQWAKDAAVWGHPFFLRFDFDINYDTNPWCEQANGNSAGQFVPMWQHVVTIFRRNGATNVTWVWTPAQEYNGSTPLAELYPGGGYVDWVGTNAYNVPPGGNGTQYQRFSQILTQTYNDLQAVASSKPVIVAEMASPEVSTPNSKAGWITDALSQQLPTNFPNVKAFIWQNTQNTTYDFRIESSQTAQQAFANAVASPVYASNQYANLTQSPIPPPSSVLSTNSQGQTNNGGNTGNTPYQNNQDQNNQGPVHANRGGFIRGLLMGVKHLFNR